MSVFQRTFWAGVQNMGEFTKYHGEYEQFDRKHVERGCFQVFPVRAKEATRVTDRPLAGNTFIESSDKSRFLPTLDRKHFYGNIVWRTVCIKNTDHGWAQVMRSLYIVKECEVRRFSWDFQWTAATWGAGLCVTVSLTPWNGTRTYTYVASVKLLLLLLLFTEEKKESMLWCYFLIVNIIIYVSWGASVTRRPDSCNEEGTCPLRFIKTNLFYWFIWYTLRSICGGTTAYVNMPNYS